MKNTKIVFGYRDGGNYKARSSDYILSGTMSPADVKDLMMRFEDADQLLIPNQLSSDFQNCCPSKDNLGNTSHDSEYDVDIDHPYHRILSIEETDLEPNVKMCAEMFCKKARNTKFNEFNF